MSSTAAPGERAAARGALAALAGALALLSLTVGFGAVDLLSPWILHEGTQVTDVGYGTLAGIVIPVGLLSQLRRPREHVAGLQQVVLAALAYLLAGALAGETPLLLAGAVVALALAPLVALHPARLLARRARPSPVLLVLALAVCAPGSQYALHMAFNQRNDVPPFDAHLGLHEWAALSAAALAVVFTALLAALRTPGFVVPALAAGSATLAWGAACLLYPESAGALSSTWALLAIGWAAVFVLAAVREGRRYGT